MAGPATTTMNAYVRTLGVVTAAAEIHRMLSHDRLVDCPDL
jgi:hypothetical protein